MDLTYQWMMLSAAIMNLSQNIMEQDVAEKQLKSIKVLSDILSPEKPSQHSRSLNTAVFAERLIGSLECQSKAEIKCRASEIEKEFHDINTKLLKIGEKEACGNNASQDQWNRKVTNSMANTQFFSTKFELQQNFRLKEANQYTQKISKMENAFDIPPFCDYGFAPGLNKRRTLNLREPPSNEEDITTSRTGQIEAITSIIQKANISSPQCPEVEDQTKKKNTRDARSTSPKTRIPFTAGQGSSEKILPQAARNLDDALTVPIAISNAQSPNVPRPGSPKSLQIENRVKNSVVNYGCIEEGPTPLGERLFNCSFVGCSKKILRERGLACVFCGYFNLTLFCSHEHRHEGAKDHFEPCRLGVTFSSRSQNCEYGLPGIKISLHPPIIEIHGRFGESRFRQLCHHLYGIHDKKPQYLLFVKRWNPFDEVDQEDTIRLNISQGYSADWKWIKRLLNLILHDHEQREAVGFLYQRARQAIEAYDNIETVSNPDLHAISKPPTKEDLIRTLNNQFKLDWDWVLPDDMNVNPQMIKTLGAPLKKIVEKQERGNRVLSTWKNMICDPIQCSSRDGTKF